MEKYLSFRLNGGKVFPYFILIWFTVIVGIIANFFLMKATFTLMPNNVGVIGYLLGYYAILLCIVFVELLCMFYIYKMVLNAVYYDNIPLKFDSTFPPYLLMIIKGSLLTIITLGIYYPWFIAKYTSFFANNSSYDGKKIEFKGLGMDLFCILLCTSIILLLFYVGAIAFIGFEIYTLAFISIVLCVLTLCVMTYLVYRWFINFKVDGKYSIVFKEGYNVSAPLFIAGQIALSLITLCIYIPAADIKIFKYFAERVRVKDEEGVVVKEVGCELNLRDDYLYVLVQYLLIAITLGVYTPWGLCFIYQRYLSKTYTKDI